MTKTFDKVSAALNARDTLQVLLEEVENEESNHFRPKSTNVRFGPKADKRGRGRFVRYVPKAVIQGDSRASRLPTAPQASNPVTPDQGTPMQ
jgi:hypothetical protein